MGVFFKCSTKLQLPPSGFHGATLCSWCKIPRTQLIVVHHAAWLRSGQAFTYIVVISLSCQTLKPSLALLLKNCNLNYRQLTCTKDFQVGPPHHRLQPVWISYLNKLHKEAWPSNHPVRLKNCVQSKNRGYGAIKTTLQEVFSHLEKQRKTE